MSTEDVVVDNVEGEEEFSVVIFGRSGLSAIANVVLSDSIGINEVDSTAIGSSTIDSSTSDNSGIFADSEVFFEILP
ncbi:MAG: hypothetical protein HC903_11645 [Methylacidiphilales bacterium]|nr:hypothetical protein [Candidatus Methylacidiphilales bacterium]